jgi:GH43 family beta-xylosidase
MRLADPFRSAPERDLGTVTTRGRATHDARGARVAPTPRRMRLIAATLLALVLSSSAHAQQRTDTAYPVLLQDGADPWMIRHGGWYYLTVTTGGDVSLWRSRTITGVAASERKVVFRPPPGMQNLWAPELHHLDGAWYVYVAADDGRNENHRMYVLECLDADPFTGAWRLKGKISDTTDRWAIDGTVATIGSERFFVWSGWEGADNVAQHIYIARMLDPWTLASPRVRIASPTLPWEANTRPRVLEGPQVYVRGGTINLLYSASGSWTDGYSLGLLTAPVGADLLDPRSWLKRDRPLMASGNGIVGPGHGSIVASPDGREDWLIFHSARWPGAGWTRQVRAQRVTFSADGALQPLAPASPDAPQRVPSGEPARVRFEAERGLLAGGARVVSEPRASGGVKVGYIDRPDSFVELRVTVARAGFYTLHARMDNGTFASPTAVTRLTINGGQARDLRIVFGEWDRWTIASARVFLVRGVNRVRFTKREHYAELDCVDVAR